MRPKWANWESLREAAEAWPDRHPRSGAAAVLAVRTARSAMRVRIMGLAAESAFFSLLSLPALLLGLIGALSRLTSVLGQQTVLDIRAWMLDLAATVLTAETVNTTVAPMVDDFLGGAHGGVLSLTFLVSLWSGSRAMSVFIEAITIAYGLDGMRGYLSHRLLAFVAYLGALLFALVVLPVIVAGPEVVRALLPVAAAYLHLTYWPLVGLLSLVCIVALYTLSVPVRAPLVRQLPGAVAAVLILLLGTVGLRIYLDASFGQANIYGSLTAPIVILIWLYLMALAVLAGSSLNAEIDAMWPVAATAQARAEIAARRQATADRLVERREEALQRLARGPERTGSVSEAATGEETDGRTPTGTDRAPEAQGAPAPRTLVGSTAATDKPEATAPESGERPHAPQEEQQEDPHRHRGGRRGDEPRPDRLPGPRGRTG
ncbi:YihY/virulence factor BrkB family protein [Thermobifida halotolerans]|uniref:YihY/virulence factor BrkB family protein n=1 Tax=Thermobifida halotolerans TaxID=483545 RepID=UPI001FB3E426|nr:YihY/virulence factor BrkB family protein [Thermobifida halotolerans]